MNKYETLKIFDYSIFISDLNQIDIHSKCLINTLNQYSFNMAEEDKNFKSALKESDVLLPDGIGITTAARVLEGKKIKKIAGADVHIYLLQQLNINGGKCFYLGAAEETLIAIKNRLATEFPNIEMGYHSPPFKSYFSEADNNYMVDKINAFHPDILFVGMTAPKQEKWVHDHKEQLDVTVICSIGAVFDFYSGTIKRPGQFWINLGLEWFIRLLTEPYHLWRRYLVYGPVFVFKLLQEMIAKPFRKKDKVSG